MRERWRSIAREMKTETYALYLAYRDPRVSSYVRVLLAVVVGYAFSPIDLIPDFIPILGYLDDLVLVPVGIALALRMVPRAVMDECRQAAREIMTEGMPVRRLAASVIVVIWILCIALVAVILRGSLWK